MQTSDLLALQRIIEDKFARIEDKVDSVNQKVDNINIRYSNDRAYLAGVAAIVGGVSDTDTVTLRLRFVQGNTNNDVSLTAWITSVSFGATVGEVSSAQISFQATGALTAVTI